MMQIGRCEFAMNVAFGDRLDVAEADTSEDLIDPQDEVDEHRYPTIHQLADGLAEDHFEAEFESGLAHLFKQIEAYIAG